MSHTELILDHLKRCGSITQADAYALYGCTRLSGRIYDLKARGHQIERVMESGVNRYGAPTHYARYTLSGGEQCQFRS